ncbi:MAG: hypothetical protein HQL40_10810 [Alphaproteobacteria bacterium]|nr:hypothetical protein [Alphaproteobacteria bacterium]
MTFDEFSATVGALRAEMEESRRQRGRLFERMESIQQKLTEVVAAQHQLAEAMARQGDVVEGLQALKQRGLGVLVGVALTAGGAGASLAKLIGQGP